MAYLTEIDHGFALVTRYRLEAEIRSTKQGDRTIQELYEVMNGLWNELSPMDPVDSSKLNYYKIYREEHRLIQFLLALRDEFEPLRRSILGRSIITCVEDAVRELKIEENRLKYPSNVSEFSSLSLKNSEESDETDFSGSSNRLWLKILSYNVLCREDLELHERMKALDNLIQLHSPDVICFQEITSNIYNIFKQSDWWMDYSCSVSYETTQRRRYFCMQLSKLPVKSFFRMPFNNSTMGKELCVAKIEAFKSKQLIVATTHLPCPSPNPPFETYSQQRVAYAKEALNLLESFPNVIFCGDMNWDDSVDGSFPLLHGWIDAWEELRPHESGWTFDTVSNQMSSGNRPVQKRLDRFICGLSDFKLGSIEMIGTEAIPGLWYYKKKKVMNRDQTLKVPVLPSDHYGLLLEVYGK